MSSPISTLASMKQRKQGGGAPASVVLSRMPGNGTSLSLMLGQLFRLFADRCDDLRPAEAGEPGWSARTGSTT